MDRRVALAMANLDIPQNWNVLGSHSGDGESRITLSCNPTQITRFYLLDLLNFIIYTSVHEQKILRAVSEQRHN